MRKAPVDRCPNCGSNMGFYSKDYIRGKIRYNYNFDGSEAENGEMYDTISTITGKWAYCCNCHKRLFRVSEVIE